MCLFTEIIDGQWSEWGNWSTCDADFCSYGNVTRNRTCDNPPPLNGAFCEGNITDMTWCWNDSCPSKLLFASQRAKLCHRLDLSW